MLKRPQPRLPHRLRRSLSMLAFEHRRLLHRCTEPQLRCKRRQLPLNLKSTSDLFSLNTLIILNTLATVEPSSHFSLTTMVSKDMVSTTMR
jgi:hypothetical protein